MAFAANKVILAADYHSIVPLIKGIECTKVSDGYLLGTERPGKHVVVIGGGLKSHAPGRGFDEAPSCGSAVRIDCLENPHVRHSTAEM